MIIDASVAVKLLTSEEGSREAALLLAPETLAAPELMLAEVTNAIWAKARRGQLRPETVMLSALVQLVPDLVPGSELLVEALALAVELDHPAYDCFYLALAIARDDRVVTADRRLASAVASTRHAARVLLLSDVPA